MRIADRHPRPGMAVTVKTLAKRFQAIGPLALLLFGAWIVFTAKTNWTHLLLGAIMAVLIAWLSSYLLGGGLDPRMDKGFALRFPLFSALLFWEIIKANWDVLKRVLAPSLPISPRIVDFESYLESDLARTILANAITLTPGTVTLEIDGSRFYIHWLAEDHAEDPGDGTLQRMTAWLCREGPLEMRKLR